MKLKSTWAGEAENKNTKTLKTKNKVEYLKQDTMYCSYVLYTGRGECSKFLVTLGSVLGTKRP